MTRFTSFGSLSALILLTGFLLGCGDSPSDPSGGATPTPAPTPAPTPVPTPTPTPEAKCTLAAMPDCGFTGCCQEGGSHRFADEIAAAQADLARTNPEMFDSKGAIRVSEKDYTDALAKRIVQITNAGVCSVGAGGSTSEDEIRVKRDNNLAQHVDVILSNGQPWVGGTYTCRPATF